VSGLPGDSIWFTYRLPIAYGTIALVVLVAAGFLVSRVRKAIAKERRLREREESLR
jgi:hypothetical protein